jgi:GNAT superfamily N-acetyltransferase
MVNIRTIEPDDLDELVDLYSYMHPPADPRPRAMADQAVWSEMLSRPGLSVFVGVFGAHLVSTCTLVIVPNLTRGAKPYGILENVVTHPDHRRKGYGSAILKHALAIAWERHCYKVLLQTGSQRDGTLKFYESVGLVRGITTGFVARPKLNTRA